MSLRGSNQEPVRQRLGRVRQARSACCEADAGDAGACYKALGVSRSFQWLQVWLLIAGDIRFVALSVSAEVSIGYMWSRLCALATMCTCRMTAEWPAASSVSWLPSTHTVETTPVYSRFFFFLLTVGRYSKIRKRRNSHGAFYSRQSFGKKPGGIGVIGGECRVGELTAVLFFNYCNFLDSCWFCFAELPPP